MQNAIFERDFFLEQNRLAFYFTPLAILDFITIVPGIVSVASADYTFDTQAWTVARTLRVFRIFR